MKIIIPLAIVIASLSFPVSSQETTQAGDELIVTLLGTGRPIPEPSRFSASTLVEAGGRLFLFDSGRGASIRISQIGSPYDLFPKLEHVFLTHLHSDHIMGLADIFFTGWIIGRTTPFQITGPTGTHDLLNDLKSAFKQDIYFRSEVDTKFPVDGLELDVTELEEGQVVYDQHGVLVTAFLVDHAEIEPAFGYRVDYAGNSVVLSGDTRYSENLIRHAKGVDLLIHEVAQASEELMRTQPRFRTIVEHHTNPEEAGRLFSEVQPELAVYSHIISLRTPVSDLIPRTRSTYAGEFLVGEDLMKFTIRDGEVAVEEAP